MGFMDKAKKMAEQAQTKLDEAQKQFNQRQDAGGPPQSGGPAVEYDKHGRPIPSEPPATATPPHGDPVAPPPPPKGEEKEDPNRPSYAPPKMTSGDPLG